MLFQFLSFPPPPNTHTHTRARAHNTYALIPTTHLYIYLGNRSDV